MLPYHVIAVVEGANHLKHVVAAALPLRVGNGELDRGVAGRRGVERVALDHGLVKGEEGQTVQFRAVHDLGGARQGHHGAGRRIVGRLVRDVGLHFAFVGPGGAHVLDERGPAVLQVNLRIAALRGDGLLVPGNL